MIWGIITGIIVLVFVVGLIIWLIRISPYKIICSTSKKHISRKQLSEVFLKLNKKNPFNIIKENDFEFKINWKIVSAKWREVLGMAWKDKTYHAWVSLDEKNKQVNYAEAILEKEKTLGAVKSRITSIILKGTLIPRKEQGKQYSIKKDFSIGEVYDYKFSPKEIKKVIMQIALKNGWNFKMVLFPRMQKTIQ